MNRIPVVLLLALSTIQVFSAGAEGTPLSIVYGFGTSGNPNEPITGVALVGSTLYGTTSASPNTLFEVGVNGTGYKQLHAFNTSGDGYGIYYGANMTVAGTQLFGTTADGGANGIGAIYKINSDGSGYSLLHSFAGAPASDGAIATGPLTLSGNTLYGMTQGGGANNRGAIYKINSDGSGYSVVYSFDSGAYSPSYGFVVSGSELFGITQLGGANGNGDVFEVNVNGTGFTLLHSFPSGSQNSRIAITGLTLVGSTLYGASWEGFYDVNTDGSDFNFLNTFGGQNSPPNSGANLVSYGSLLIGTTGGGGPSNSGTIFEMGLDGSDYTTLDSFNGNTDGQIPNGLLLSGSTVFGTTEDGGPNGGGSLFSFALPVPEPPSLLLAVVASIALMIVCIRR